jgi:hypothetical protein
MDAAVAVAGKFCAGWTSLDAGAFSMQFAPEGYYTDIAFGITRRGRDQVREHHRIWREKRSFPTARRSVLHLRRRGWLPSAFHGPLLRAGWCIRSARLGPASMFASFDGSTEWCHFSAISEDWFPLRIKHALRLGLPYFAVLLGGGPIAETR